MPVARTLDHVRRRSAQPLQAARGAPFDGAYREREAQGELRPAQKP